MLEANTKKSSNDNYLFFLVQIAPLSFSAHNGIENYSRKVRVSTSLGISKHTWSFQIMATTTEWLLYWSQPIVKFHLIEGNLQSNELAHYGHKSWCWLIRSSHDQSNFTTFLMSVRNAVMWLFVWGVNHQNFKTGS